MRPRRRPAELHSGTSLFPVFATDDPRQFKDKTSECVAAHFEIAILIERGARRREQHDRLPCGGGRGTPRGCRDRLVERSRGLVRYVGAEGDGKFFGRFANQVRLANSRKEMAQLFDAAGLRPAAGDPKNIVEASKRLGGGIGVGCLRIVDEEYGASSANFLHGMRETRKGAK